jgi:hypothetical protein
LSSVGTTYASSRTIAKSRPRLPVTTLREIYFFSDCIRFSAAEPTRGQSAMHDRDHFSPLTKRESAAAVISLFFWWVFSQWNKQRVNLNGVSHRSECFKLCKDYKS